MGACQNWKHASTQTNCAVLRERGVYMIGPTEGSTACGEEGLGRLSEPTEIANSVMRLAMPKSGPLRNKHAIVTSGPTYESIDPVRFIGNHSSGKQGHAIARALSERGVKVTLISGPVNEETPKNVTFFPVNTAIEMLNACEAALPADIAICAAAVGDWRLQKQHESKLKKPSNPSEGMSLQLVQNPDILAKLSKNRDRPNIFG